jgi:hypothetical protein
MPYLAAIGVQPDQVRAQRTFALRLGRGMIPNSGGASVKTGRLDYLIVRADGRPLFVVELKGPDENLTDDDRDQGISYARLVDPMAPLVLVSNGSVSHLYDTITRERIEDPASAALIRDNGRLTDDESLRARVEALEHFIGFSSANIAMFSRAQRASRMETVRGAAGQHTRKYETDLYLPRDDVRRAVKAFLRSQEVVFALGGLSGSGKTNEMCALAEELGETHVALFFNGPDLVGPLGQVLADEFDWHFSEVLPLPQICRRLASLATRSGRPMLIFIDAVDEVLDPDFALELADLATRLKVFEGQVRLLVSAKPQEWKRFIQVRGNPSALHNHIFVSSEAESNRTNSDPVTRDDAGPFSTIIGHFTPQQRDQAVERYCTAFGLDTQWPYHVREMASDPFMLRMIAEEAAATGNIPHDPGERDLIRRYIEQKVRRAADPELARLELITVAKALAQCVGGTRWIGQASAVDTDAQSDTQSVSEREVRTTAGLPATTRVAEDLVAFGVLLRSRDRDGNARLAFAYDRVRDYMVATHALGLAASGGEQFRNIASACLISDIGAAALDWYLPYTTDEQWERFVDAATDQVQRVLDAYDALRAHLASEVRAVIEPRTVGPIGLAFSGNRRRSFALGFFRRELDSLPRVCFDPSVGQFYDHDFIDGVVPTRLMGDRHGRSGFWFLRDPERYAATRFREELEQLVKDGMLVEAGDTLARERIVALTITHASKVKLRTHPPRRVKRFADYFVGRDLFPLDLKELHRAIQVELAFRSFQDKHMRRRTEEELEKHRAAGHVPQVIATSSAWTPEDLRLWRQRASELVDEGHDFTPHDHRDDEMALLAHTINTVLERQQVFEDPPLPPPDVSDEDAVSGVHTFEDGYSDPQLARLVEYVHDSAFEAYDAVLANSFSDQLIALLPPPTSPVGVLCFRRPASDGWSSQFRMVVESGTAFPIDPGVLEGKRVIAAIVTPGGAIRLERVGTNVWVADTIVSTPSGRFGVRVRRASKFVSMISPDNPPPFVRTGPNSSARLAPVRAMVYKFVQSALMKISPEQLLSIIPR